ncbi:MAG: L,D-transpeptidase [Xanthobacteraceae bacterium]
MYRRTAVTLLFLLASLPAEAAVQIDIDKDNQTMTVAVDGAVRYRWPVSSGLPAYETPNGNFKAFRMEEDHFSKEFDDAPMPHSIFFTKRGHAIHGTDSVSRLGNPASHGCVRLSRANAATLFALVKAEGVLNTTVTLSGSSQVALARGGNRRNTIAARPAAGVETQAGDERTARMPQRIAPEPRDRTVYYDEYGRRVPVGRNWQRSYEADSYYAERDPYAQQQTNPYARRTLPQPSPGYQVYGNDAYGQPRYYTRPQYGYGSYGY